MHDILYSVENSHTQNTEQQYVYSSFCTPKRRKSLTNEQKQEIQQLQLTSDIFFGIVLEDMAACQEVVRIITGEEITLVEVRNQETILQLKNHSICIDIWAEDILKRNIGIEMHPQSNEDRVKRNRYTIACLDLRSLKKGEDYADISDTVGIYITQADFLKTKKGVNVVKRVITKNSEEETSIPNGISEYYVSLSCEGDNPAQTELLKYMKNSDGITESEYFPNLVKRVKVLKEEQKGEKIMCEIIDKFIKDGEARGEARGRAAGMAAGEKAGEVRGMVMTLKMLNYQTEDIVVQLINNLKLTEEEAMKYL